MEQLWAYFKAWVARQPEDVVEKASAFMCICPDGSGWIGDGAGRVPVEFDSIEDGYQLLAVDEHPEWNSHIRLAARSYGQ